MRVFCLLLAVLAALVSVPALAADYDGRPNRYHVTIDPAGRMATVSADLWIDGDLLSLFNVMDVAGLEDGQASLIERLRVTDAGGQPITVKPAGDGDFRLAHGGRVHADYRVRLEHERYTWPAGREEVGYWTDEGVMLVGASLFLADGGDAMRGPIDVAFDLPAGWRALTPWKTTSDPTQLQVSTRRELLSNALFLGTADAETFDVGGVAMTLVLGRRYVPSKPLFVELLRTQLASYETLFGAKPLSDRYLIVINEDAGGDGGAFANSFSQFIAGDADARNRVIWGYVMAHELLHFWNGLSLVPADEREEWFKEGATDYLTIATLARNGLIDETLLYKRLENVPRRYLIARYLQGLRMTVREAGRNKAPNRQLVYGGGSLAAMALDVELRKRSGDKVGLPQLMQALYREFGKPGAHYTLADIERIAQQLTGSDFRGFFAGAVESEGFFDIRPSLADLGLRMDSFLDEMFISPEPSATPAQKARFKAVFGR